MAVTYVTRLTLMLGICWALLLGNMPAAWADQHDEDPFQGRLLPVELVMAFRRDVNLSKAQNEKIGSMVVDMQKDVAAKQWAMQTAYFDLLEVMDAPTIDEDEAIRLVRQAIDAENDIKVNQIRMLIQLRNLLDEDQIAFLRARLDEGWPE